MLFPFGNFFPEREHSCQATIIYPLPAQFFNGTFYHKLIEDLQLTGKAKRTVYGYVRAVRKLAEFCEKPPQKVTEQDVRLFLLHQIVEKRTRLRFAIGTPERNQVFLPNHLPTQMESSKADETQLRQKAAHRDYPGTSF